MIHDDPTFLGPLVTALSSSGYEVAAFNDPMTAWETVRTAKIDALITRVQFGRDKPHGIALARWARTNSPGVRVLFAELPEFEPEAEGVGAFLPMPADVPKIVEVLARLLADDTTRANYAPPLTD